MMKRSTLLPALLAAVSFYAGHLLALCRAHFGGALIPLTLDANAPVDAVAAWDQKTGALSLPVSAARHGRLALPVAFPGCPRYCLAHGHALLRRQP